MVKAGVVGTLDTKAGTYGSDIAGEVTATSGIEGEGAGVGVTGVVAGVVTGVVTGVVAGVVIGAAAGAATGVTAGIVAVVAGVGVTGVSGIAGVVRVGVVIGVGETGVAIGVAEDVSGSDTGLETGDDADAGVDVGGDWVAGVTAGETMGVKARGDGVTMEEGDVGICGDVTEGDKTEGEVSELLEPFRDVVESPLSSSGLFVLGWAFSNSSISRCNSLWASP